jgi:hypothetical protein
VPGVRRVAAALLLAASLVVAPALSGLASAAPAAGNGGGLCTVDLGGQWITVQCQYGPGGPGSPGGGGPGPGKGGKVTLTCVFTPIGKSEAGQLGLQWPPPKGFSWAFMQCIGGRVGSGPLAVLVSAATGAPVVTPQQLLQQALQELQVPTLRARTAPPLGQDALVGLPEWFWVARAQWHPVSVTVSAGPVWATATATPTGLSFQPGAGLGPVTCAGPGTTYKPARLAARQRTDCSFTYLQPSAGQPGNAYQASITVTWNVSWTGSGGTGGELNNGLQIPFDFAVPVAQGEALVKSS